jgi:hypothetical protein
MRPKIVIGLLCVATTILAWTGMAGAQAAPAAGKAKLPSGETVRDLSGDWDALVENYGAKARYGNYPNVFRITQTGSAFSAIRLKDNPPPSPGRAGSPSVRGELDKDGVKQVWIVDSGGSPWESKGQVSEDGKQIVIDNGAHIRYTLTRP